jgi:Tol biopolymer transport system component
MSGVVSGSSTTDRGFGEGLARLWTMNSDGSEQKPLTDHDGFRPTWSHDGSKILFSANGLFVVRPDGSGLRALPIRVPGNTGFADWTE